MKQKLKVKKGKPGIIKTVDVTLPQVPVQQCRRATSHGKHVWLQHHRYTPSTVLNYCKGVKELKDGIR